ncbi:hypothetical protein SAMN05216198_1603 [Halopseudomonas litoralis]|uniref:Secreted protein n=1 Tax=Halopseudomonas litoralis TaxID=797277 RepID=A0A1H1QXG0_9GAMM|nr:hypothetical protein [Halopseudomonas litoralis]SDS28117.1 hypothetical protein SAMN05216198_1603 [Halopseudomonas litoralis]
MHMISKLIIPFVVMLFATVSVAEDGSNNALSGVRPAGAPPHVQTDGGAKKSQKQVEDNKKEVAKDK